MASYHDRSRLCRLVSYIVTQYSLANVEEFIPKDRRALPATEFNNHLRVTALSTQTPKQLYQQTADRLRDALFEDQPFARIPFPATVVELAAFQNSPLQFEHSVGGMPIPWSAVHYEAMCDLVTSDNLTNLAIRDLNAFMILATAASRSWTYNPVRPWSSSPSDDEKTDWLNDGELIKSAIWVNLESLWAFNPYAVRPIIASVVMSKEDNTEQQWLDFEDRWIEEYDDLQNLLEETGDPYEDYRVGAFNRCPEQEPDLKERAKL